MNNKKIYLWGALFITAGLVFLLGIFLLRIILAIILIGIGIRIIQKGSFHFSKRQTKQESIILNNKKQDILVLFNNKEYILIPNSENDYATLSFHVLFSECQISIPEGTSYRIKGSYGFADVTLPDEQTSQEKIIGDFYHMGKSFNPEQAILNIKLNAWMSKATIREIPPQQ